MTTLTNLISIFPTLLQFPIFWNCFEGILTQQPLNPPMNMKVNITTLLSYDLVHSIDCNGSHG